MKYRKGQIGVYQDGTIDIEMLDILVGNGWALWDEFILWARFYRLFEIIKPKKYLVFKKNNYGIK